MESPGTFPSTIWKKPLNPASTPKVGRAENSMWPSYRKRRGSPVFEQYLYAYVATEKIVGRGGPKIMTGWGVKIWLQGRGQLHGTGRG